jgi:Uma2 family endonuclease
MTHMSLAMPRDHEWTVDDLANLPDDGLLYELVDGVLLVTAAPNVAHQRAAGALYRLLTAACPEHLEVFVAPLDFQPTSRRSLQPDVLVVAREHAHGSALREPLALAVEVLSPSTRARDLVLKPSLYAEAGVEVYWVVDPDEVSITTFGLQSGAYVQTGFAQGAEELATDAPYAVRIVPADLLT